MWGGNGGGNFLQVWSSNFPDGYWSWERRDKNKRKRERRARRAKKGKR